MVKVSPLSLVRIADMVPEVAMNVPIHIFPTICPVAVTPVNEAPAVSEVPLLVKVLARRTRLAVNCLVEVVSTAA